MLYPKPPNPPTPYSPDPFDQRTSFAAQGKLSDPQPPRWLRRLTEFDAVDTAVLFLGLPTAYAAGGVPGVFIGGVCFVGQMLLRKTPLLPGVGRVMSGTVRLLRGDREALRLAAGNFLPFLEDEDDFTLETPPAWFQQTAAAPHNGPGAANTPGMANGRHSPATPQAARYQAQGRLSGNAQGRSFDNAQGRLSGATGRRPIYRNIQKLPPLHGYQIVIYGPTGSGKSSVIKALLVDRQEAEVLILDPHYQPGSWPGRATVVGAGLAWHLIDQALDYVHAEMRRRYQILSTTPRDQVNFRPLIVAVDELSALTGNIPNAGKRLFDLAQQGRKVQVWTMLTPHSTEVEQMGAQGRGDARENFAYVEMPFVAKEDQARLRIVTVYYGNPRRSDNQPVGIYAVPAPKEYTGTPSVNPEWLLPGRVQSVSQPGQGVSKPQAQGVSKPVSQGVSGAGHTPDMGGHGQIRPRNGDAPGQSYPTANEFAAAYGRDGQATAALIHYLLQCGYGTRKIGEFMPFSTSEARQVVQSLRNAPNPPEAGLRPVPGSREESDLVCYLRSLGAPLPRIAALLDGNDADNLLRMERYG